MPGKAHPELLEALGEWIHFLGMQKSSKRPQSPRDRIVNWLRNLSPMELSAVCSIQNRHWIQQLMLTQPHAHRLKRKRFVAVKNGANEQKP